MTVYNEIDPFAAAWLRELMTDGLIESGHVDTRSIKDVRPDDLRGATRVHLFAGIGGWDYALRLAGWPADRPVWTGSCPCQPFSAAGKRKGQADERHLWPEMFRLIRECRPDTIFGEQVASAIGHGWLDGVFADLESEGYACGAVVLGAHSVGAPHIRQRLWWVAYSGHPERRRPHDERPAGNEAAERAQEATEHRRRGAVGGLADAGRGSVRDYGEPGIVSGETCGVCGEAWQQRIRPDVGHGGNDGRVGHAKGEREGAIAGSAQEGALLADGDGRLVLAGQPGLEGHAGDGSDGNQPGRVGAVAVGSTAQAGDARWTDSYWHRCRDGKARRVPTESALFPLADGLPGRVGLLRGAGNAIVPQAAAEFVTAFMEAAS